MSTFTGPGSLKDLREIYNDGLPFPQAKALGIACQEDYLLKALFFSTKRSPIAWAVCYRGNQTAEIYAYIYENRVKFVIHRCALVFALHHAYGLKAGPIEKLVVLSDGNPFAIEHAIATAQHYAKMMLEAPCNLELGPYSLLIVLGSLGDVRIIRAPIEWRSIRELAHLRDCVVWETRTDDSGLTPGGMRPDPLDEVSARIHRSLCCTFDREYRSYHAQCKGG